MEFKFFCLLVIGISALSGAEAQACVAGGDPCLDANYNFLGSCCGDATCTPSGFGGFCMVVDSSCIAGGYPCKDNDFNSLGPCCSGKYCIPVPGAVGGGGYCVSLP